MDVDDEIVATIPPKTLGRRISEELGKEPRRKSPSVRDSLGEAYVRKVADWLEAGGPRGSMEEMYSSFSEANGHTKSENENASADMFDSTMYFDSTQTWDAAEYALKNAQHPGNATNGRVRRRSAEATYVRNSRMAEKKTDLTQNFTEDLRFEDPLDHHDESDSVGEEQDEPDIPSISQPGELVIALNAGSPTPAYSSSGIEYLKDQNYVGGDVLRTEEKIGETAEQALYQTARYGNISYKFTDLPCGDFYVDLHFAEIVFSNGPSGMRVFDVYIQGEKVISDLDVYGEVGSNKALILCAKTCVVNGSLIISFEGVIGNPTISAICVRRAPYSGTIQAPKSIAKTEENVYETSVEPVEVEHKSRRQQVKSKNRAKTAEYEAKLEALKNECHEAWISLQDSNRSIERLQNELVSKSVTIDALANVVETQEAEMKELKDKAEGGMLRWKTAFANLFHEMEVVKANFVILARETKDWITTFPDTTGMTSAVQLLVMEHEELRKKYVEESLERRQLYNKVLELKGNIRVFCRCRPLSSFEVTNGASSVVEFDAVKDNELIVRTGNASKKLFKFDRVFTPQDDQGEVFANTAPVVVSVLDGYNVCIFAYGQTGTGKTFTMEGTTDNRGVNYRTLEELFHVAELRKAQFNYEICVSVLEVYNEQIRDLLAPAPEPDQAVKKLEIRQLAEGGHHVPGLVEAPVQTMTQVWDVLQVGSSARAVESTNSNEHSSRSHCMLCVMVKGQNLITGECTRSKLWLVDLAGSERVAKSDVIGDRLREAQSINKSLSALGDVIAALTTKSSHIPFRNSKLTHLLQDSLGGDSKTLMFVQISPNEDDVGESLCSLNFASRVRGVELGPARKQLDSSELFKYKQLAERAKQEGRTKEEAMKKVEDNLRNTEVKLKIKEHMYQVLVEKMKEKEKAVADLEAQLAAEKKARLAATAALKEKGSQHLEKVPIKEVKVPTERVPERRPLLEKVQEFSEPGSRGGMGSPRVAASPRFSAAPVREPVEKEKPHNENADPQHTEAAEEVPPIKPTFSSTILVKFSQEVFECLPTNNGHSEQTGVSPDNSNRSNSSLLHDFSSINAEKLSRFLFVAAHIALKHLVYIESCVKRLRKQRGDREKAAANAASELEEIEDQEQVNHADQEENISKELGLNASEDAKLDDIVEQAEKEIVSGVKNRTFLIGAIAPIVVKLCKASGVLQQNPKLKSSAVLALCKLMAIDANFCERNLQLLFTIARNSSEDAIRSNCVIALGDLALRFPNLLEPWLDHMYARVHDSSGSVRKNSVLVLSHLILNDMIKVKGHISELAIHVEDEDQRISDLVKLFFHELSKKGNNPIYNLFPDILSRLSCNAEVSQDSFYTIMQFLMGTIKKCKQMEGLIEKLCNRFLGTSESRQWQSLAYCLSQLNYTQSSLRKLSDSFKFYEHALGDDEVFGHLKALIIKTRKLAKAELKLVLNELEEKLVQCHNERKEQETATLKAETHLHRTRAMQTQDNDEIQREDEKATNGHVVKEEPLSLEPEISQNTPQGAGLERASRNRVLDVADSHSSSDHEWWAEDSNDDENDNGRQRLRIPKFSKTTAEKVDKNERTVALKNVPAQDLPSRSSPSIKLKKEAEDVDDEASTCSQVSEVDMEEGDIDAASTCSPEGDECIGDLDDASSTCSEIIGSDSDSLYSS